MNKAAKEINPGLCQNSYCATSII